MARQTKNSAPLLKYSLNYLLTKFRPTAQPDGVDFLTAVGSIVEVSETFSKAFIGHDASSSFLYHQSLTNPQSIVRQFTFNNSNFSGRVTKYNKVKQSYKDVMGKPFSIEVENASQLMNTIIEDRTLFRREGAITYGYQTHPRSADVLTIGTGVLTNTTYRNGKVNLNFRNKLSELAETPVSTNTTSFTGVSYIDQEYNPADIVFDILTSNSFGAGFSSIASNNNGDINYDAWVRWKQTFTSESITLRGYITYGTSYLQALRAMAEITDSAIYVEADNRMYFIRNLVGVESFRATVVDSDIISITTKGDAFDMCNQYTTALSFAVADDQVGEANSSVTHTNSISVNSFGIQDRSTSDNIFWYTNSANANNLAQRITFRRRVPEVSLSITTPIKYLQQQLGDLIYVTANEVGIYEQPYTLIERQVDVERNTITMELSVGNGLAVANMAVFTLGDSELGRLDNTVGLLA